MRRAPALAALLLSAATTAGAQSLALTRATVHDGTGGLPIENAVIHVEDGRIACIGGPGDCPIPGGVETVDLTGKHVTPGLIDAHVHFSQTGWFDGRPDSRIGTDRYDYEALQTSLRADPDRWHRAYLCSGVTTVFDVGALPWTLEHQAALEADDPGRVRYVAAGPLITHFEDVFPILSALGTSTFLPMETDAEAVESVRQLADWGAKAVKVWYLDPPEGEAAALDARLMLIGREARARGLPLIVHATELRNAKVALRAGAHMLVHSVEDRFVDEEFLALAKEAGTYYAPTLIVGRNWRRAIASVALGVVPTIDDPNGCVEEETRTRIADAPALRETLPPERRDPAFAYSLLESSGRSLAIMEENLRRVHAAGIPIVVATDAGNPLTVHGPSIYPEMEAMERAGIPAGEVLVMATRSGARLMGLAEDVGTLEAGKRADLVVLAEDPAESPRAFRTLTHVVKGGSLRAVGESTAQSTDPATPPWTTPWTSTQDVPLDPTAPLVSPEAVLDAIVDMLGAGADEPEAGETATRVERQGEGRAVGTIERSGLPDDSVEGHEIRVEMRQAEGGWVVESVEERWRCRRGVTGEGLCL